MHWTLAYTTAFTVDHSCTVFYIYLLYIAMGMGYCFYLRQFVCLFISKVTGIGYFQSISK